jgi:hypothetical protein
MKQRHKYLCCVPERDKVQITVFVYNIKAIVSHVEKCNHSG